MKDLHYYYYLLIDRHPIILLLMLTVIYLWVSGISRQYIYREVNGDKKAKLPGSLYMLACVWIMVGIFEITMNHWGSITGQKDDITFIHEHRYDIITEDSILHSPLCGCRENNNYISQNTNDSVENAIQETDTLTP